MNLLYTITAYPPSIGGAQIHTHQLARILAKQNPIQVVSFWDRNRTDWLLGTTLFAEDHSSDYEIDNIPVHRMGFSLSEKLISLPTVIGYYGLMGSSITRLARLIEKQIRPYAARVDIIHNVRIGREPISFASLHAAKKEDIPFIFSPLHHPRWSGWRHRYYHQIYREADALIALTEAEKEALVALGAHEERVFVTGIGPVLAEEGNGKRFRSKHSLGDQPIILFLGQKYPYKGLDLLIESGPLVWKKVSDAIFFFAGPRTKYSEKLFKEISDPRIIEIETLDLQEKTDALDACTLLCLPSTQESFGGVFTEAWWMKKPVIGCRIPAVESVISDVEDGFLVDSDPKELSEKIITLLLNSKVVAAFGLKGRSKVERLYTWQKLAEKTMAAYEFARG